MKFAIVDTRIVYLRMPLPASVLAPQLKVCVVTVLVDPFGVDRVGTEGAVVSIATVQLLAHVL